METLKNIVLILLTITEVYAASELINATVIKSIDHGATPASVQIPNRNINVTELSSPIILKNSTGVALVTVTPQPTPPSKTGTEDGETGDLNFSAPKVISVSANDDHESSNSFSQLPIPLFHFPRNDDLEETFTYQVKKQKRHPSFSQPSAFNHKDELNYLRQMMRSETNEDIRNYVNDLNDQLNTKFSRLNGTINQLTNGLGQNITSQNVTIQQLNTEIYNLTTLSKETSRSIRALQYAHELERTAFHLKVANLTGQLDKFRNEKTEDFKRINEKFNALQSKIDNSTQDLRMHEAYIRYGQQLMATMKTSLDKNEEKILELQTDGGPQQAEQTVGCGGVLEANSGIIGYKFRQPYMNNERCVWIIRANRRSKITLQLLEDGFQNQSNSDFLTVTEFAGEEPHPVTLITSSRLEHGDKVLHTFQGPVIFLTFYSDASIPGNGFLLKYDGISNKSDATAINAIRYTNLHLTAPVGTFSYPTQTGMTYQPNELVAVSINPYGATSVKIHMKKSDLEKDEYCEFDSLNLYGSASGSYALTKRYCEQGKEFDGESVQISEGVFLAIFRSDSSTQFTGFQFSWEAV